MKHIENGPKHSENGPKGIEKQLKTVKIVKKSSKTMREDHERPVSLRVSFLALFERGICDLISQKASFFEGKDGISRRFDEIPDEMKAKAWRYKTVGAQVSSRFLHET